MKILIARTSGFCDGVKRAMRIATTAAEKNDGLWADGPLVHNKQALELLALHGVDSGGAPNGKPVLIRAHGARPEKKRDWQAAGYELVDATCVHVAHNQRLAAKAAAAGQTVVLAGDADHAETVAVAAAAGPNCVVVSSVKDIENLDIRGGVFMLAQTTFNVRLFAGMADALKRRFPDARIRDTICRATHDRQEETARLARLVDALVVVGGKNSANTRRLTDTGRAAGKPVFQVETAADLRAEDFAGFSTVAVTSGASTPGWVTQEVVNRLRGMGRITPSSLAGRLVHPLVESRVSTALSAGGMALAAGFLLHGEPSFLAALAGACYVFFAHTLNRRVPPHPRARLLSNVDTFYQERRPRLLAFAWTAAGAALALSAAQGPAAFTLLLLAVVGAALYAMPKRSAGHPDGSLKRLGPRSLFMAAGWAITLAGPQALTAPALPGLLAIAYVFLLCFGGAMIRDLHDVASDRLMGIATLPSRLGPAKAKRLAATAFGLAALAALLFAVRSIRNGEGIGAGLLFSLTAAAVPCLGLGLLELTVRRRIPDAIVLQAGVDGMGMLAGAAAVLFSLI